jgi:hypothetical protein
MKLRAAEEDPRQTAEEIVDRWKEMGLDVRVFFDELFMNADWEEYQDE